MKQAYKLDKKDIKEIIAKHFDTTMDRVHLDCYMDTIGYGMGERQVPMVSATVEKERKIG